MIPTPVEGCLSHGYTQWRSVKQNIDGPIYQLQTKMQTDSQNFLGVRPPRRPPRGRLGRRPSFATASHLPSPNFLAVAGGTRRKPARLPRMATGSPLVVVAACSGRGLRAAATFTRRRCVRPRRRRAFCGLGGRIWRRRGRTAAARRAPTPPGARCADPGHRRPWRRRRAHPGVGARLASSVAGSDVCGGGSGGRKSSPPPGVLRRCGGGGDSSRCTTVGAYAGAVGF